MKWTPEQLRMIERMGAAWFTVKKCAAIMEMDFDLVKRELNNNKSEAYKAYYRGWYLREMELSEGIQKMAARGSNPAQQMARKMLDDAEGRNKLGQ